jgi:hypothetical protein
MGRKLYYRVEKAPVQISKKAFEYISARKSQRNEPFYSTLDRLISNFKLKDTSEIVEENERLKRCVDHYVDRNRELEERLKSRQLTLNDNT